MALCELADSVRGLPSNTSRRFDDSGEYHAPSTPPQLTLAVAHPRSASLFLYQRAVFLTSLFCGRLSQSIGLLCLHSVEVTRVRREAAGCLLLAGGSFDWQTPTPH